jgi:hypothetical protein
MNAQHVIKQEISSWPVVIFCGYIVLFPVSLLQSVVENPALSGMVYALKGVLVLTCFLYIFIFRRKFSLPVLGVIGFGLSILLNAITVNKFTIDIWALYILSFLVFNLTPKEQRKLISYSGWIYLLTPFLLAAGTLSGILKSDMWVSEDGVQFSFGLTNPNYFMFFFLYACFSALLLRKTVSLIIVFICICLFYFITETRSVLIGSIYILLMYFMGALMKKWRTQFVSRGVAFAIVFGINISLGLMLLGYYDVLELIAFSDSNLRSRVISILEILDFLQSSPGILLFGGFEAKMDNMYLNLVAALGIIHFFILWLMIHYALIRNIISNNIERFTLISSMLLLGFIEHGLYSTILPSILVFVFITESKRIVFKGTVSSNATLAVR